MTLVELPIELVDAGATATSLFVHCTRPMDNATAKSFLRLTLLRGPRMWRADVHEKQKPIVLDCSPREFLDALEAAFTDSTHSRFSYKWSEKTAVLTLSESAGSGIAMKYASLTFTEVVSDDASTQHWNELLHGLVVQGERSMSQTTQQRQRIQELEGMIAKKDALLETALTVKQRLEDELFTKFCAVLNGKKEEIDRLQRELAMASASSISKTAYKPNRNGSTKRRATPGGRKKAVGAKLSKKTATKQTSEDESEEEEDVGHDDSEDDSQSEQSGGEDDEEDESPKKPTRSRNRVKRDAINAYSQLASELQTPSQVCAAADVLDDLDEIMKTEVENDDELTTSTRTTRKRPIPAASAQRPRSPEKKPKTDPPLTKKELPKAKAKPKPTSPPRKAIDSEEEDILDMLS